MRFIADESARVAAIEKGGIDLAPATPVAPRELSRLKALPDLRFETNGYQYTNQVVRIEFNLDNAYFKDLKVRQAIAHAIIVQDLPDLTLLAPTQVTIHDRKIVDHTVTADGVCGNLADVHIQ